MVPGHLVSLTANIIIGRGVYVPKTSSTEEQGWCPRIVTPPPKGRWRKNIHHSTKQLSQHNTKLTTNKQQIYNTGTKYKEQQVTLQTANSTSTHNKQQ
jgi:hypothetical protein